MRGGLISNPMFADATQVHCVNPIGRSWRTWKRNQITLTYLNLSLKLQSIPSGTWWFKESDRTLSNIIQKNEPNNKTLLLLQGKLLQVPPFTKDTLFLEHISEVWDTIYTDTDPVFSAKQSACTSHGKLNYLITKKLTRKRRPMWYDFVWPLQWLIRAGSTIPMKEQVGPTCDVSQNVCHYQQTHKRCDYKKRKKVQVYIGYQIANHTCITNGHTELEKLTHELNKETCITPGHLHITVEEPSKWYA